MIVTDNKNSKLNNKKCPKCHGTGKNHIIIMASTVYIPDPRNPPKKPVSPFTCDRCNGTGVIPLIEPIRMGN